MFIGEKDNPYGLLIKFILFYFNLNVFDYMVDNIQRSAFVGLCGTNTLNSPHFVKILDVNFNVPIYTIDIEAMLLYLRR